MVEAGNRNVGIPARVFARHTWIFAAAAAWLVIAVTASAVRAAGDEQTAKYWKGKYISEATKQLGEPTQMTPLMESGKALYIFANPNEPHWVFETEPNGKIVKATKVE
jgi:hypothetical protein